MQPNDIPSSAPPSAAGISGKDKSEVQRWTEEEEERLLRAVLEIASEPVESFDATVSPVERVRRSVGGEFPPKEIVRKTKQLRKRYEEMCCRRLRIGRGEADAGIFGAAFEISDQIWGSHGGDKDKSKEEDAVKEKEDKRKDKEKEEVQNAA